MATRRADLSALGTSSVLDALSSDHSDVELSPPSEPEYDDVSKTTSNSPTGQTANKKRTY